MAHFKSYSVAPARWTNSTDIDRDPRTCTIFILEWGSNWGYSGFSHYQNNRDSSWAYVLQSAHVDCGRMYGRQNPWTDLFKSCLELCNIILFTIAGFTLSYARYGKPRNGYDVMQLHARIWKGLYPKLELHGWRCHYTGQYRSSGISGLLLWKELPHNSVLLKLLHSNPNLLQSQSSSEKKKKHH